MLGVSSLTHFWGTSRILCLLRLLCNPPMLSLILFAPAHTLHFDHLNTHAFQIPCSSSLATLLPPHHHHHSTYMSSCPPVLTSYLHHRHLITIPCEVQTGEREGIKQDSNFLSGHLDFCNHTITVGSNSIEGFHCLDIANGLTGFHYIAHFYSRFTLRFCQIEFTF